MEANNPPPPSRSRRNNQYYRRWLRNNNTPSGDPELAALLCRNGMSFQIINGQRHYGPPNNHVGPPPPRGCEVFVGAIPKTAFEPELVPIFERIGQIYDMRILITLDGYNRGYCFVQYYSPEDAERAIVILDKYEIRPGHFLGVINSVDNNRLYVGGIPRNLNRMEILEEMQRISSDVVRVIMSYDVVDTTNNRGFAFVEYATHRAASLARSNFLRNKIRPWGQTVNVGWAQPESNNHKLYVKNLPPTISGKYLEDLFNANSDNGVTRVNKADTSAHISFISEVNARQAQKKLNNCKIEGYQVQVFKEKRGRDPTSSYEQNGPAEIDDGNPVDPEDASGISEAGERQKQHPVHPMPPWPFLLPAFQRFLEPSPPPSPPPSSPTPPPAYFPWRMPTPRPNMMGPAYQCSCQMCVNFLPIPPQPAYLDPTYAIAGPSGDPIPVPMQINEQFPMAMPVGQFNTPYGYPHYPEVIPEE